MGSQLALATTVALLGDAHNTALKTTRNVPLARAKQAQAAQVPKSSAQVNQQLLTAALSMHMVDSATSACSLTSNRGGFQLQMSSVKAQTAHKQAQVPRHTSLHNTKRGPRCIVYTSNVRLSVCIAAS